MASDPRRPLIGGPPETLKDTLQALVGGGVRVDRDTEEIERRYQNDLQFRVPRAIRGLLSRARGQEPEPTGTLDGLAWPESKRMLGLLPGQEERVLLRDSSDYFSPRHDRETLMHEFGHIADFRKTFPEAYKAVQAVRPKGVSAAEHYADVFMVGMSFLQDPASRLESARVTIDSFDRSQPGTKAIIEALLQHPLYRQHPLAGRRGLL
jgi:hypothetical protein